MDQNIYESSRPAVTIQYRNYIEDNGVRDQVDSDWARDNQRLTEDGFSPIKHPYGDKSLREMGINKIKSHKFSDR